MTDVDAGFEEYFRAVEAEFVRRRGAAMLLSPRDWALIGAWRDAGIPLRVVLQAIDTFFNVFSRRPAADAGRRINSLAYCRQEVLALDALHRTLRAAEAGRPSASPTSAADADRAVARHLGRLQRQARQAMAAASSDGLDPLVGACAGVAADLRRLRKELKEGAADLRDVEKRLRGFDETLIEAARAALPREERRALEEEAGTALRSQGGRMSDEARETTRRALVARALRTRCRLPRLTLFD